MTPAALRVEALTITDPAGREIVGDVGFAVRPGEVLLLIGETGSGKSLIAQALLGLLPPGFRASGAIAYGDHPPVSLADQAGLERFWASHVMLLPQEPQTALDPTMRVGRQILPAGVGRGPDERRAFAAVDLPPDIGAAYPFALSGGMAQRVLVASALLGRSPVIIADEPTTGLDPARQQQALGLMRTVLADGRALLAVTHDIDLVRALGGRIMVLHEGRIVEEGETRAVLASPCHPYTRAWIAADPSTWRACPRCHALDALPLAAHGLTFGHRRNAPLARGLDLHLPRGSVLAVTGPSGCGKSTLGDVLLGLRPPFAGEVLWAGSDPYRGRGTLRRLRPKYQKLHQDPATAFLAERPIGRQLADLAEVAPGLVLERDLPPVLDQLKLRPALLSRRPGDVSGGEAQRLALARLLLMKPDVIVADEPTSRLDPLVQQETVGLLRRLVDETGLSLVLIGHHRALLAATADEILDLADFAKQRW